MPVASRIVRKVRGRVSYYAFPVVWTVAAIGVLLLGSSSEVRNAAVMAIGAVVAAEGLVLALDVAGAASAFAAKLRESPRSALALLAPWSVRLLLGGGTLMLGGMLVWGGARYL